ncbi:MAG: hypothetical protein P8Y70_01395 [Candidatus Lokiarchaeota archaeon]
MNLNIYFKNVGAVDRILEEATTNSEDIISLYENLHKDSILELKEKMKQLSELYKDSNEKIIFIPDLITKEGYVYANYKDLNDLPDTIKIDGSTYRGLILDSINDPEGWNSFLKHLIGGKYTFFAYIYKLNENGEFRSFKKGWAFNPINGVLRKKEIILNIDGSYYCLLPSARGNFLGYNAFQIISEIDPFFQILNSLKIIHNNLMDIFQTPII